MSEYQQQTDQQFSDLLFKEISVEWQEFIQNSQQTKSKICAKNIDNKELYFKCFDCANELAGHCYCQNCYFHEDHIGHRTFYYNTLSGGVCDCGDMNLTPPIFCRNHKQQQDNQQLKEDQYEKMIPDCITTNIKDYLYKIINDLFNKLDQLQKQDKQITQEKQINEDINKMLDLLNWLSNKGILLTLFIGYFLCCQKLPNFMTFHDCKNNEENDNPPAEKIKLVNVKEQHQCQCPIIGLFLKYILFFPTFAEGQLELLLIKLFINDTYKLIIVNEYCNNYSFVFRYILKNDYNPKSVCNIFYQFFSKLQGKELISQKNLRRELKANYIKAFDNIQEELDQQKQNLYLDHIIKFIRFILKINGLQNIWMDDFIIFLDFLQNLSKFKIKQVQEYYDYIYYIHYQGILINLSIDIFQNLHKFSQMNLQIKNIFLALYNELFINYQSYQQKALLNNDQIQEQPQIQQEEQQNPILEEQDNEQFYFDQLLDFQEGEDDEDIQIPPFLNNNQQLMQTDKEIWPIANNDIRLFTFSLISIWLSNKFSISKTKEQIFQWISDQQFDEILIYIIKRMKETLKFLNKKQKKVISQKQRLLEVEEEWNTIQIYIQSGNDYILYDYDYGALQLCLIFLPENKFLEAFLLEKSDTVSDKELFLHNVPQMMIQGVYLLNIIYQMVDIYQYEGLVVALKEILINSFYIGFSQLDLNSVKQICQQIGMSQSFEFQQALKYVSEVTDNQKFKVLKQYQNVYDPYIFMHNQQTYSKFYEKHKSQFLTQGSQEKDTVFGNQLTVQSALIESELNIEQRNFLDCIPISLANNWTFLEYIVNQIIKNKSKSAIKVIQIVILKNINNGKLIDYINQFTNQFAQTQKSLDQKDQEVNSCFQKLLQLIQEVLQIQKKQQQQQQQQVNNNSKIELDIANQNEKNTYENKKKMSQEKQKKTMEQFLLKQKQFNEQFSAQIQQQQKQHESNLDIQQQCIVCHNSNDDINLVLCYLSQDNSSGQEQYIMTSCGHLQHYQCLDNKQFKIQHNNRIEMYCPQCKFVSNTCLIYLDPFYEQKQITLNEQLILLEKFYQSKKYNMQQQQQQCLTNNQNNENIGYYGCQIIEEIEKLNKSNTNQQSDIFKFFFEEYEKSKLDNNNQQQEEQIQEKDQIFTIESMQFQFKQLSESKKTIANKLAKNLYQFQNMITCETTLNQNKQDQDYIFNMLIQTITFSLENSLALSVQEFMKTDYLICRNTYLTYLLYQNQHKKPSKDFNNKLQLEIKKSLEQIYDFNRFMKEKNQISLQQQQQKNKVENLCIYQILINFSVNFLLYSVCDASKENQDQLCQIYLAFLQLFFNQLYIFYSVIQGKLIGEKEINFQKLINIHSNKNFISQINSYILPYVRLSACIYISIFKSEAKIIEEISSKKFYLDEEEINFYQQNIFHQKVVSFCPDIFSNELQSSLYQLDKEITEDLANQILHTPPYFRKGLIQLEQSYKDMHKNYYFKTCSLCKYFPKTTNSDLYVCLVCGINLCSLSCKQEQIKTNLSYHAQKEHLGIAVFYQVKNAYILIMHNTFAILLPPIYTDEYSQTFKVLPTVKFEKYKLDQKEWNKLNDYYRKRQIPQQTRYLILKGYDNRGDSF